MSTICRRKEKVRSHINRDIEAVEKELDDDSESIIVNERYEYISSVIKECYKKKNSNALSVSDKIDKVVTNRFLGLPIFACIMFLVYYIAMVAVGTPATDWTFTSLIRRLRTLTKKPCLKKWRR